MSHTFVLVFQRPNGQRLDAGFVREHISRPAGRLAVVKHDPHPKAEVAIRIPALCLANVNKAKLGVSHGLQVNISPLKGQQLADAQAGIQHEQRRVSQGLWPKFEVVSLLRVRKCRLPAGS